MQVWDQVKVLSGDHEGKAGTVQATDKELGISTVKLDTQDAPHDFEDTNLQFLGR